MDLTILNQYNVLDLILIAVLIISVLVGLIRGVVREILSVASWAISIYIALRFAPLVSEKYVKQLIDNDYISYVISFVGLIIVGLFAIGLVNLLISQLFRVTGLSFLNRLLGMVFGCIRGVILGAVAIWVIGLVPSWTKESWFIQSTLVPHYRKISEIAMQYLPDNLTEFIRTQQTSPELQRLKLLADEQGIEAVLDTLKKKDQSIDEKEVESLIQSIKEMQGRELQHDSSKTRPKISDSIPPKSTNSQRSVPDEQNSEKKAIPAESPPVIELESTD